MQYGSVTREDRKNGPAVWSYRWWEPGPNRKRIHRRLIIGSLTKFKRGVRSSEGDCRTENGNQLNKCDTELHDRCPTCGSLPATRTDP
jgi:hypothetical protein